MMNHFSSETMKDGKGKELPAQHFISSESVLNKKGKTKGFSDEEKLKNFLSSDLRHKRKAKEVF